MQQGNKNQVVSAGTRRFGSAEVYQSSYWTSETGHDTRFALSQYGFAYGKNTNWLFNVLKEEVEGNKYLAVIIISYSDMYDTIFLNDYEGSYHIQEGIEPYCKGTPWPNIVVFRPLGKGFRRLSKKHSNWFYDAYYEETKELLKANLVDAISEWVLIKRILQPHEKKKLGYNGEELIYTSQWQTRKEFVERIGATIPFFYGQRSAYLYIKNMLLHILREDMMEKGAVKDESKCRTFCVWLNDYEFQADDSVYPLIPRAFRTLSSKIDWTALPMWKDYNCDF